LKSDVYENPGQYPQSDEDGNDQHARQRSVLRLATA
jgi:hypothetical protein